MKRLAFTSVLCAFALVGCTTLSQSDRDLLQKHRVSPRLSQQMGYGKPLSLPDILELTRRRVPASFMVRYLRSTYAVYRLKEEDLRALKRGGVSSQVISYLLVTPSLFAPRFEPEWYPYGPYYYGFGYPYDAFYSGYPYDFAYYGRIEAGYHCHHGYHH